MQNFKQYHSNKMAATLIFVIFVIAFTIFSWLRLSERENAELSSDLKYFNAEATSYFKRNISDLFDSLERNAEIVSGFDDIISDKSVGFIKNAAYTSRFDKLIIVTKGYEGYTSDGEIIDLAGRQFISDAMAGEATISELLKFSDYENEFIAFSCPIFEEEKVIGVISALLTPESFAKMADLIIYDNSKVYIINEKGGILNSTIISGKYGNFFTALLDYGIAKGYSITTFENDLLIGQENIIEYNDGLNDVVTYYRQLGINNWFIVTEYTKDFISGENKFQSSLFIFYSITILALLMIYIVFMVTNKRKYINIWKINVEALDFLYKNSDEIYFEIDPQSFDVIFSDGFVRRFGNEYKIANIKEKKLISDIVHKDDVDKLNAFADGISGESKTHETVLRFRTGLDNYKTCRIITSTVFDDKGKPIRAIGRLFTSEEEIAKKTKADEMIRQDLLTGLYNKLGTKALVDDYLSENSGERGSLLLAEIVDFEALKTVCDKKNLDNTIAEAGDNMQKFFRSSDIIGRTGENEFTVMMKKVQSLELITEKASEISHIFNNAAEKNSISRKLTVNVGISSYPDDADNFTGLYKKSHRALSAAKPSGKDIVFFSAADYEDELSDNTENAEG